MSLIARVRSWVRASSRRADFEREMRDEMRTHIELYEADLRRLGVPESEARRRARAEFGGIEARKEDCRDAVGLRLLDELRGDVSYGVRLLRRSPAFTLVALLSLGLGIGANTAIFSLIDTVLVKTLPVDDPQRLFFVDNSGGKSGGSNGPPYPCFERLRDHNRFLSAIAAFDERMLKVSIDGVPERVRGQYVSGSYFDLLGVRAAYGRLLTPADDAEPGRGGPQGAVAVISDGFWTRRFGRDPAVLGKNVQVGTRWATIVGVTPPGFFGLQVGMPLDITLPMMLVEQGLQSKQSWWLSVIGRLAPGATVEQARRPRGNMGRVSDGGGDDARQARLLQWHSARPGGQGRQRPSQCLRRALDDRHGDRRRRAPHRLRQCRQPAARPRRGEAERNGGAAGDWREPWQADPPAPHRRPRAGVARSRSRTAVRAVGRVVSGQRSRRPW